jgi:hypothetical protein
MKKLILILTIVALTTACEKQETKHAVYSAWMRANEKPQDSLSFDEWVLLYDREMLPGMDVVAAKRAAATASAMSAAALSQSATSAGRK